MIKVQAHTRQLKGTSYEIGYQLGQAVGQSAALEAVHTAGMEGFGKREVQDAVKLFDRWCPGLAEELGGFAEALKAPTERIFFYGMTYLIPRCSQIALLPGRTAEGLPLLARNYEFSPEAEDFCLLKTSVTGKYTHLGTSVLNFGREDGVNEHGLAVTMSSCGFPVGAMPHMRVPALKGLQFWAVIRALLENCKNVEEALAYTQEMPIAFNINLMLLDKGGNAALLETLDGHREVKRIGPGAAQQALYATNHAVLPGLVAREPKALVHSARRYAYIEEQLAAAGKVSKDKLKEMLLSMYPKGLCCHFYQEYFGTTKSMIISPAQGTVELCWGGDVKNGWNVYDIGAAMEPTTTEVTLTPEKADPAIFGYQPM